MLNNHSESLLLTNHQICARIQRAYDFLIEVKDTYDSGKPLSDENKLDLVIDKFEALFEDIIYKN